jgi:hypothetical protein
MNLEGKNEGITLKEQILQEEEADKIERDAAWRRAENHKRRRAAKENNTSFISVEEEEKQKEDEAKKQKVEKTTEKSIPEIWKSLAFHKANIVGKIDLEEMKRKPKISHMHESVFKKGSVDDLYQQALHVLGNEEVNEDYVQHFIEDFITIYNIDEIEENIKEVIEKQELIKRRDTPELAHLKKLATILEAILIEGVTKYDWLGEKIKILAPSKFDELCRGIDAVIELSRGDEANEFLALGIDVSFRSVKGEEFELKVENLLKSIDRMRLTQIKYFKDNQGKPIENLFVPKVIISVDGKAIEDLIRIWENKGDEEESFKNHTIAIDMMGQIAEQCKIFSEYARSRGIDIIANTYDEVFELLLKISQEVPRAKDALVRFEKNKFVGKIQEIIDERTNAKAA